MRGRAITGRHRATRVPIETAQSFRTGFPDAIDIRQTPTGYVGFPYSGEGIEAVWVSKDAEKIDRGWFQYPRVRCHRSPERTAQGGVSGEVSSTSCPPAGRCPRVTSPDGLPGVGPDRPPPEIRAGCPPKWYSWPRTVRKGGAVYEPLNHAIIFLEQRIPRNELLPLAPLQILFQLIPLDRFAIRIIPSRIPTSNLMMSKTFCVYPLFTAVRRQCPRISPNASAHSPSEAESTLTSAFLLPTAASQFSVQPSIITHPS